MDPIIDAAINAQTVADVDRLEGLLKRAFGGERVRYLGDREANWSAIAGGTDPTGVLFERVTNMWDANIELEAERRKIHNLGSTTEAAATFFGVTDGMVGLGPIEREQIGARSRVILLDSDQPGPRPTVAFRDLGTGIVQAAVPTTILSLEESNKLRKPYTHGVFGKGGSTACAFSDATIVVTRRQPDLLEPGEEDRVTVAVVREADAADMGLPFFRYLVGADRLPYSVPAIEYPSFEPGTLVLHINYQAGRMGTETWQQEESIYTYGETILFDPTLPYQLQDMRTGAANRRPEGRGASTLAGLSQRLEQLKVGDDTLLAASKWQSVAIPDVGDIKLRWWLFTDTDKRRRRAAKGNVILFTTNGQVHHAWDQAKFQQLVDSRRRVGQRLLAEVDCDGIEIKRRYKVFDSFRVQVRRGPEGRALEEAVAYALSTDADLGSYESEFVRQTLGSTVQNVSKAFRDRLNRALTTRLPGITTVAGSGGRPKPPKPKTTTDLYPEPTSLTGPEEITLLIGGRATAYMEINAVDGFVPDKGVLTVVTTDGAPVLATGVGDLRRGRLALTLQVPAGTAVGKAEVEITLEWIRGRGGLGLMTWPMRVVLVDAIAPHPVPAPKPAPAGGTEAKTEKGAIAFMWVNGQHDMDWSDDVVGELQAIKGSDLAAKNEAYEDLKGVEEEIPTLVLNKDFAELAAYRRATVKGSSDAALSLREERYALGVGVMVANLELRERAVRKKHERWAAGQNGIEEPPKPLDPGQIHRALAEGARGVVAILPDFDAILGDLDPS